MAMKALWIGLMSLASIATVACSSTAGTGGTGAASGNTASSGSTSGTGAGGRCPPHTPTNHRAAAVTGPATPGSMACSTNAECAAIVTYATCVSGKCDFDQCT